MRASAPTGPSSATRSNMNQLFITGGIGPEAGEGGVFRIGLGIKGLTVLPPKH